MIKDKVKHCLASNFFLDITSHLQQFQRFIKHIKKDY
jgi:hypothetical protein